MKFVSVNHNDTCHHQPTFDDNKSDASQDTQFHLDFLDKIDAELETNPLNDQQKEKAKTQEARFTLNRINKKQAKAKTLKVKPASIKIKK